MNYIKVLFLSSFLIAFPVFSEVETTSSIRGTVNIAGATVEITNQSTGQTKSVSAGSTGGFSAINRVGTVHEPCVVILPLRPGYRAFT